MKRARIFTILLALALGIGLLAVTASAAETVASGTCGTELTWALDDAGTLTISGTGSMDNYASYRSTPPWDNYDDDIKAVVIEDGVTSIGSYAFYDCDNLESMELPDSLTDIYSNAVAWCEKLADVTIPDGVDYIGERAFLSCKSLTEVVIPDSVTYLGVWSFAQCDNLKTVVIGDGITTLYERAFANNPALESVTLPDRLTCIGVSVFDNCPSLAGIVIPDTVAYIESRAFAYCESLTSIVIPDEVTDIYDSTFVGCTGLETVQLHEGITSIGSYAFENCTSLKTIQIPADVSSLEGNAFQGCTSLDGIWVDADNAYYCSDAKGVLYDAEQTTLLSAPGQLKKYTVPNTVTAIEGNAFSGCQLLESIVIPDTCASIGSYAFENCVKLSSITLPDTLTVLNGGIFENCTSLTSITVPDRVTEIGDSVFAGCTSLEEVKLGSQVTSLGFTVFDGCTSLTEIELPASVTTLGFYTFQNIPNLTAIWVDKDNQTYSSDARGVVFDKNKTKLVTAPDGISGRYVVPEGVITIGGYAFNDCVKLTGVHLPDSLEMIDTRGFLNCQKLSGIRFPDGLTEINDLAFFECSSLTELYIPASVTYLGYDGFSNCTGLQSVTFACKGTTVNTYWSYLLSGDTLTAYYPAGDDTWTEEVMNACSGDVTWVEYEPMDAPAAKASNVASSGKVSLTWNKVDGAAKYKVYRATSATGAYSLMKTTTGTSYTNTSAKAGSTYYYYVVAVNADGAVSAPSAVVSRTCDVAQPVVKASNVASSGKIKLTWDAVDGAAKYEVYRSATGKTGSWSLMKTTTGTSYTNTSAKAGTQYYYKVRALASKSAANSAYSAAVSRTCDLAQPVITLSSVASSGKIKVTWKAVDGAVSYKVYRSTTGKDGSWSLMKTTTGTSFTNTSAKAGTQYYYKVIAIASKSAANSAYSAAKYRTCDLARPVVTIALKSGKPRLTWDAVEGASGYKIYRATSSGGTYSLMKTTTATSYTNTSAVAGNTYYYKVIATHTKRAANSAYSLVKSITAK